MGKLYTNKEPNVIKRLQAHNIVACTFKTVDKTVNLIDFKFKDNYLSRLHNKR